MYSGELLQLGWSRMASAGWFISTVCTLHPPVGRISPFKLLTTFATPDHITEPKTRMEELQVNLQNEGQGCKETIRIISVINTLQVPLYLSQLHITFHTLNTFPWHLWVSPQHQKQIPRSCDLYRVSMNLLRFGSS
jgi:hypothetical protein